MEKPLCSPKNASLLIEQAIGETINREYSLRPEDHLIRDLGMESIDLVDLYFKLEQVILRRQFFVCLSACKVKELPENEKEKLMRVQRAPDGALDEQYTVRSHIDDFHSLNALANEAKEEIVTYKTPAFSVARLLEIVDVYHQQLNEQSPDKV